MSNAPFTNILVYLDGSEGSLSALMYAIMLSRSTGARLHALYVINTKALGDLVKRRIFIDQEMNEYLEDLKKDAERHLRHAERTAMQKDVNITCVKAEGSPHSEVMKYIKENHIDLLALASINTIRSRREELVSESDRMLRTSPCPVIVVKDTDDIWQIFEEDF
ncbi:MAG TPA: universal stress protein [Candidatus Ornithospirochaeta avicola]|uniref:Universal stress protein n=1 Tax=Candidatus Ornithospirochaeta avicola TaxID=2840896 RepID=A0A9D1TMZ4_9SPIO|nr:universal stress protein [Candidatus Ornithospirochaeta avicola]